MFLMVSMVKLRWMNVLGEGTSCSRLLKVDGSVLDWKIQEQNARMDWDFVVQEVRCWETCSRRLSSTQAQVPQTLVPRIANMRHYNLEVKLKSGVGSCADPLSRALFMLILR